MLLDVLGDEPPSRGQSKRSLPAGAMSVSASVHPYGCRARVGCG